MKKKFRLSLIFMLLLSFVIGYVVYADVGDAVVISDTSTKVFYAGYEEYPDDWNTPGFDDSDWEYSVLYQNGVYLDPATEEPFKDSGSQWISYCYDQTLLPDYYDPSVIDDVPNRATYLFRKTFKIPASAYNISGTVALAADNYGELYLNGVPILSTENESGVNYRIGNQVTGIVTVDDLQCENVIAAKVDNGALASGTDWHGPVGLLFLLELEFDYELPAIVWLAPVTNNSFDLQNGTTLPIKFEIYQDGKLITSVQDVVLQIYEGTKLLEEDLLVEYSLGDSADSLRIDHFEYHYVANFDTRDYEITDGTTLTAVILDGCMGDELGSISFVLYDEKGTDRGNQWGGK